MTRNEAIVWLERIEERYIHGGDEAFDEARKEALHMAIKALERKKGEWEVIDYAEPRRYGCSNCHIYVWHQTNYCPNCGSYMRGDENE